MEIPVKNSTDAMKIKHRLRERGIRAYIGKRSGENGCYFYLSVSDKKYSEVINILDEKS